MPLVSVIIPVYNTEKYLDRCINSVLAQTLSDIEVLLIDDGSTDGSGKICDDYARKDKRIHVIHTSNQGVSHARNRGLEQAKGEYISFIDSDDWIDSNMLETLFLLIKTRHTDLSTCGYTIEEEQGNIIYNVNIRKTYILDKWKAISSLFHDSYYRYKGNLWDKLYDKKIIDDYQIRFNNNIYYNEDRLFIFQYLNHCHYITYTTTPYYHYIIRNTSAMYSFQNTYNKKLITFMDAFDIMSSISLTFPQSVRRSISTDYIKNSILFFAKYSRHLSLSFIKKRIRLIIKNTYASLPFYEKIKYSFYYIKILIFFKCKR